MTTHRLTLPRPGGEWQNDPDRTGLRHRGGNPWNRVRLRRRIHRCRPQSCLTWTIRTRAGTHPAKVLWCSCGAVRHPGIHRWLAKNIRRVRIGIELPWWHRNLIDLDRPASVFDRLRAIHDSTATSVGSKGQRHMDVREEAVEGCLHTDTRPDAAA